MFVVVVAGVVVAVVYCGCGAVCVNVAYIVVEVVGVVGVVVVCLTVFFRYCCCCCC